MAKPSRFAAAASGAVLASLLAGCASSGDRVASASGKAGDAGLATRALAALNANDLTAAIDFAERAVERSPDDAGFRGLLGNAYFAAGRFGSAEAAYRDALSIYDNQPKVILRLVLAQIAQGKTFQASAVLDSYGSMLDAGNYGLALALVGRLDDAVPALEQAARGPFGDARLRQNLALAYALSGDWTKARTVASQDVPGDQLDQRIAQWMQFARPAHPSDQVASLTGVTPAAIDPGQPVRLALVKTDTRLAEAAPAQAVVSAPVEVAEAAPPAQQEAPVVEVAEAVVPQPETLAPAPPPSDPARVPAVAEEPAPVSIAMAATASPEAPAAFAAVAASFTPPPPAKAKPKPKARPAAAPVRAALRHGDDGSVMQLGAYSSPKQVSAAWAQLTKRYPALRDYLPMRARFDAPNGTYWRLSISGFETQRDAIARCKQLKSKGGSCFVRDFAGDAPVRMASH
jgi:Flp pilus assembly protein TadD